MLENYQKTMNYINNRVNAVSNYQVPDLFSQFGEIESLKLHPTGEGVKKLYAFVCFKKPDEASTAKEKLHNQVFEGRTMTINHYEIKEIREINNEAAKDKTEWRSHMHDFVSYGLMKLS